MKRFLLFSVGILLAFATIKAETYTHTFKEGELTTAGGSVTLSDVEWIASSANSIGWNNSKGIQLGAKSDACESYTLTTSAFSGFTVKSVTVNTSIASSGDAKLQITAGDATSEAYTLDTNAQEYSFDCNAKGDITISWTATQRAYYVKSITVVYELPADMVDIEEPTFKTVPGVYTAKDSVIVETYSDNSLVLYYTIDGSTPTYEGYNNKTDSTRCSKYPVIYHVLTESIVMKAIAVKTDGEAVYQSDVVEARFIVSPVKPYAAAKEIKSGEKYAFIANGNSADFMFGKESGEELQGRKLKGAYNKYVETVEYNAFTFTATEGGYTIQDFEERYMHISNGILTFSEEKPATGAVWNVNVDNDGKATIENGGKTLYYSQERNGFGCYSGENGDVELPAIYMLRDYPEYTIVPSDKSQVENLQKITVTCPEGIKAADNLKIKAIGSDIDVTFTCTQPDGNTLEFTLAEPLTAVNNTYLWINMTGDIILCPEELDMKLSATTLVNYTLTGNAAPATIESVVPADGTKVEKLSYVLFTFSYYAVKTDNTEIFPKLHAEGSEETIPVEYTTMDEEGTGYVEQLQAALKVTEPVVKNGTYILEIPDGYFVDGNGKSIKGMTLRYIVENDGMGIEDVVIEGEEFWVVYDLNGVKVVETAEAEKLMSLPQGIYIVNGSKRVVK